MKAFLVPAAFVAITYVVWFVLKYFRETPVKTSGAVLSKFIKGSFQWAVAAVVATGLIFAFLAIQSSI